ncbi:hypothetical protein BKA93DRAFT_820490 [Sparassis latifolia]
MEWPMEDHVEDNDRETENLGAENSEDEYWHDMESPYLPRNPEDPDSEHDLLQEAERHNVILTMVNHVVLVHGDLSTCERVQSLQQSRADEKTPWHRFQFVIFIMGLFHLKMACANAIWKIFIYLKLARKDDTSLMKLIAEIRPKETVKIGSKPGIVSWLDCWRQEISQRCAKFDSLEKWAMSKPGWEDIENLASIVVRKYVATNTQQELQDRDQQMENTMLQEQYFLYYEEISYAMNEGDIGCVEECFLPWALIFKGCGKHKYAMQMLHFLHDVHSVYPARLNLTGKEHKFRMIDWLVEHNNLYTKRIYGESLSNHAKGHILKESALIEVFKIVCSNFEAMFLLDHRTFKHSPPKMERIFKKLVTYMRKKDTHIHTQGRRTAHVISDAMEAGMCKLVMLEVDGSKANNGDIQEEVNLADGDLDV